MIFQGQINKSIEVYIDDMIVKSPNMEQYILNMRKTFHTLRRFEMKLLRNVPLQSKKENFWVLLFLATESKLILRR